MLAGWAAADAADQRWGPPVDVIDGNWVGVDDRVHLPAGVTLGDRLGVEYEAGGRVWADVVFRAAPANERAVTSGTRRGPLGSRLDWDSCNYCTTAHIAWAWTIATDIGPMRLPGETSGGPGDPYDRPVVADAAAVLYDWAHDHGADAGVLAGPWRTNGELLHAMYRLGYPWLPEPDRWWHWEHAARATVDGDTAAADANLAELTEIPSTPFPSGGSSPDGVMTCRAALETVRSQSDEHTNNRPGVLCGRRPPTMTGFDVAGGSFRRGTDDAVSVGAISTTAVLSVSSAISTVCMGRSVTMTALQVSRRRQTPRFRCAWDVRLACGTFDSSVGLCRVRR